VVDPSLAEELLWILSASGADFAEVYAQESATLSVSREDRGAPLVESGAESGVSLLVEKDGQLRSAAVAGASAGVLREMARRMAAGSAAEPPPPAAPGADPAPGPEPFGPDELEGLLDAGEAAARAADPRVAGYGGVAASWASRVLRLDSLGARMQRDDGRVTVYHRVLARDGAEARQGARVLRTEGALPDAESSADLAAEAGRGAALALEARPCPEGVLPVVLSPQAAGLLFHEALGRLLEADTVLAGLSPYGGRLGETVGSAALTLRQVAPAGAGGLDDEGFETVPLALVERGVLKGFLTDRRTAARGCWPRTGSGRRESFRHPPLPRTAWLALEAGEGSLQSLLGGLEMGLFVARLGAGEVDGAVGRFRFPAVEAFLVREGEAAEPVAGAALEGLCTDLPRRLVRAGGRTESNPGVSRKGGQAVPVRDEAPAVLLEALDVMRGKA